MPVLLAYSSSLYCSTTQSMLGMTSGCPVHCSFSKTRARIRRHDLWLTTPPGPSDPQAVKLLNERVRDAVVLMHMQPFDPRSRAPHHEISLILPPAIVDDNNDPGGKGPFGQVQWLFSRASILW